MQPIKTEHAHEAGGSSKRFYEIYCSKNNADLVRNHPAVLAHFKLDAKDREYQFCERKLKQELEYIHYNPVMTGLSNLPEEYKYSAAMFYETMCKPLEFCNSLYRIKKE